MKKYAEFEMNLSTPVESLSAAGAPFHRRRLPGRSDGVPRHVRHRVCRHRPRSSATDGPVETVRQAAFRLPWRDHLQDRRAPAGCRSQARLGDSKAGTPRCDFGWGTPNETVAWFVNGGFYRDHASNDLGEAVVYALGAPLSLDFGTMYSPPSGGGFVHSVVLPEASLGADWKENPPDVTKGPRWQGRKTLDYQARTARRGRKPASSWDKPPGRAR